MVEPFLNILYVGTYLPHPGGSAVLIAQILPRLRALGHRIRVLAPITAGTIDLADRYAAQHPGIGFTRFIVPSFEMSPDQPASEEYTRIESESARRELRRLSAIDRPDIVMCGRESFALHVPAAARDLGLPTLQLVQGGATAGFLKGTLPSSTTQALLAGFRLADGIVVVARHLIDTYRDLGFHDVRAIQNGVDVDRFRPQPRNPSLQAALQIPPDVLVLGHASNLKLLKRARDIVGAAGRLAREGLDFIVLIVGDGPLRQPMEEACRSQGLTSRFRFAGWVEHEGMPEYVNLTDIVIMPSESEALALIYLEAMACGRVLVASDIPAAREVVTDGHDGVLFRSGDVVDLAARLAALAGDADRRARLGAGARLTAEAHTMDTTAAAYSALLAEIASRNVVTAGIGTPPPRPGLTLSR